MRSFLIGLTAAAALALAVPGAAMAENHGDGGHGGGGGHVSGGHGGGGGMSRGMSSSRSMGMSRSVQSNRGMSARSMQSNRRMSARSARANRNFASNRGVNTRSLARSNTNARANRFAMNGRNHHRHRRGGGSYGYDYYDDYAGYDTCYQYTWTPRGYRYVNTCASEYYGAY
jgi:hypothetical protein